MISRVDSFFSFVYFYYLFSYFRINVMTQFQIIALFVITNIYAATPLTVKLGDPAVLSPGPVTDPIKHIIWKYKGDIASEWDGGNVTYFRQFKGNSELNTATGQLEIFRVTPDYSGSFRAEINYQVRDTTELQVLPAVPKPTVSSQCDGDRNYCILSCDGYTTDAGPVSHRWMAEDTEVGSTVTYNLTKDEKRLSFHCVLSNTVSSENSETFSNPFIKEPEDDRTHIFITLPVVFVLVVIGVVAGVFFYRCRKGRSYVPNKENQKEQATPDEMAAFVGNGNANNNTGGSNKETEVHQPPTAEVSVQIHAAAPQETNQEPESERRPAEDGPTPPANSQDDVMPAVNSDAKESSSCDVQDNPAVMAEKPPEEQAADEDRS